MDEMCFILINVTGLLKDLTLSPGGGAHTHTLTLTFQWLPHKVKLLCVRVRFHDTGNPDSALRLPINQSRPTRAHGSGTCQGSGDVAGGSASQLKLAD